MSALLTLALNEQGELVHVDSVPKGSACKCVCPHCKKPLDAKNGGEIREHHFAHSHGCECEGAVETALHLLAKEIMMEEKAIMLPLSTKANRPCGLVHFVEVREERGYDKSCYRPDIEAVLESGEVVEIEFFVSHKVSSHKLKSIKENQLNSIEVDLNYVTLDKEEMKDFLMNRESHRTWLADLEERKKTDKGSGYSYKRNSWHFKTSEYVKELFDKKELSIHFNSNDHNLSANGYDVCEILNGRSHNMICRGIHADLLLYRSQKTDDGRIAICIRGRRRNDLFEYPKNIRVIDIIIREENDLNKLQNNGPLREDYNKIFFSGFIPVQKYINGNYYYN